MATSGKNIKVRRQKMRQRRAESGPAWLRLARRVGLWPAVVTLVFCVAATAVALYGGQSLSYSIGQKIDQPIVARVTFAQEDRAKTKQNKEAARANTPSYYRIDHEFIERICGELTQLYQAARSAETFDQFKQVADKANWTEPRATYEFLHPRGDEGGAQDYKSWVEGLRRNLTREYTALPASEEDREPAAKSSHIMVLGADPGAGDGEAGEPLKVKILDVVEVTNDKNIAGRAIMLAKGFPFAMRATAEDLLTRSLKSAPILVYDQATTLDAMGRAEAEAKPAIVTYEEGKPFVFPREDEEGRDTGLTAEDLALLKLEQKEFEAFLATGSVDANDLRNQRRLAQAGTAGLFVMISIGLFGYVGHYQPRVFQVRTRVIGFAALFLGTLLAARLMNMHPALGNLLPVPVLLATSIISLAYDRRFAVGAMSALALLVVLTVGGTISTFAVLIGGLTVVGIMLDDVRTRTRIITAGFGAGSVMFLTAFAFALVNRQKLPFSITTAAWAGLSALLATMLVQALLPYIERAFKIATSLTLLEWRDANKPLSQLLIREAPGTYNHSLVLGTMAQSAADSIGANGLLTQVGALYHDVGKIYQAEYYAENQEAAINRHDNLEPRMSLLVILSHVKNGLALATEYGLPRILHQFIAEHHGTTMVKYFHHVASEKQPKIASGRHDREVSDTEFRYEGPKPRGKESAILMLCDGVEGAVRAMHEPTAGRIESVVHSVLMDRLQDGQFDDCDITLKDLYRVEESLVKSLCRFYHGRVAYPKAEPKPSGPAEEEESAARPEAKPSGPASEGESASEETGGPRPSRAAAR
ncbi:MAG: HDIG domain-containing protein [Phycisphaerales bacterium]|nr:MAG: HDIG domain-containing protein [Phycisphaerales bacterium]